jgi:hypothetical protein
VAPGALSGVAGAKREWLGEQEAKSAELDYWKTG